MAHGAAAGGLNAYLKSFENKDDQEKLEELLKFQKRFEAKWHLDARGRFIEDTWWQKLTGNTFLKRLRKVGSVICLLRLHLPLSHIVFPFFSIFVGVENRTSHKRS